MEGGRVRQRILDDHDALRGLLAEVDQRARRLLAGETGLDADLREHGLALHKRFLTHLALEDAILVPALREADAWGPERARRVEVEHAEQRAEMETLLDELRDATRPGEEIARRLIALMDALLVDMEHEEQAVLDPDLLRDDIVAVDTGGS